ncbi:hypothetical protein [Bartonella sp. CB175]
MKERFTREVAKIEAEKFRDYLNAKIGKNAIKLDWQATWRSLD